METIIGKEFPRQVIPLIDRATTSIDIIVYDWRWAPDQPGSELQKFNNALVVTARRGVSVRAITNSSEIINILKENKINAKKIFSKNKMHVKLMIIDDKVAIVGSHNYSMSAFTTNFEVSLIAQNEETIKRLKIFFTNLWR